jgi:hypothetical protein
LKRLIYCSRNLAKYKKRTHICHAEQWLTPASSCITVITKRREKKGIWKKKKKLFINKIYYSASQFSHLHPPPVEQHNLVENRHLIQNWPMKAMSMLVLSSKGSLSRLNPEIQHHQRAMSTHSLETPRFWPKKLKLVFAGPVAWTKKMTKPDRTATN